MMQPVLTRSTSVQESSAASASCVRDGMSMAGANGGTRAASWWRERANARDLGFERLAARYGISIVV